MTHERNKKIIEQIRRSLEAREYDDFVDLFADDGVYELPFSLQGNLRRYEGIASIRERFAVISKSPANSRYELEHVDVDVHHSTDPDVATIELSIRGTLHSNRRPISVQSSVAVIFFQRDKIKLYKDFPNPAGIAEALGLLPAYITSLTNGTRA